MFVCHDERWHIRNPTQCQVVEGIYGKPFVSKLAIII